MWDLRTIMAVAALAFGTWSYVSGGSTSRTLTTRLDSALTLIDLQQGTITEKTSKLADMIALADVNYKAFEAERADRIRFAAIAAKSQQAAKQRDATLQTALKRIRHAPQSDDGPISPVLRRELDDLGSDSVRPNMVSDPAADAPSEAPSGAPASGPVPTPVPKPTPTS